MSLPDGTNTRAIAVRGARIWVLTPDTLLEHDGTRVFRATSLCGGENKHGERLGYWHVAADERGALALGSSGSHMLVSRVDSDGQLRCPDNAALHPASEISPDGVWLARTRTGLELQDDLGWRGAGVRLEPEAIVQGVANRHFAVARVFRRRLPWTMRVFNGDSWSPSSLPAHLAYRWMSDSGVLFAHSVPPIVLGIHTGRPCELVARVEVQTTTYIPLPPEFRPRGIVGRSETDLWFPGGENVLHWDGTTWRQAAPPLEASSGFVDEAGAFWFVGARSSGAQHSSLYRVRRK